MLRFFIDLSVLTEKEEIVETSVPIIMIIIIVIIIIIILAEEEEIVETRVPIIKHLLPPPEHTIVFHKNTSTVKIVFDGW